MKIESCSSCNHNVVCPYQKFLSEAQEAVNQTVTSLKDASFLKPISVECKHFSPMIISVLRNGGVK